MLVELRDVEVYIEPDEILRQALSEGDLDISQVVSECVDQEGTNSVLNALEHETITAYCKAQNLLDLTDPFHDTLELLPRLSQCEKAQLLWTLLECKG